MTPKPDFRGIFKQLLKKKTFQFEAKKSPPNTDLHLGFYSVNPKNKIFKYASNRMNRMTDFKF